MKPQIRRCRRCRKWEVWYPIPPQEAGGFVIVEGFETWQQALNEVLGIA